MSAALHETRRNDRGRAATSGQAGGPDDPCQQSTSSMVSGWFGTTQRNSKGSLPSSAL